MPQTDSTTKMVCSSELKQTMPGLETIEEDPFGLALQRKGSSTAKVMEMNRAKTSTPPRLKMASKDIFLPRQREMTQKIRNMPMKAGQIISWLTNFKVGLSWPTKQEILMMSRSKVKILAIAKNNSGNDVIRWLVEHPWNASIHQSWDFTYHACNKW